MKSGTGKLPTASVERPITALHGTSGVFNFRYGCSSNTLRSHRAGKEVFTESTMCSRLRLTMLVFCVVLCYVSWIPAVNGFNVDVTSAQVMDGPAGSMFGYSVAILRRDANRKWILVGAPEGNDPLLPDVTKPGGVYRCTLGRNSAGPQCGQLNIDNKTGYDQGRVGENTRYFTHGKDNQWLGASIDVQETTGIVTCAPRWYNRYFEADDALYMNGICYEIPLDFNPSNIRKLPALVNGTMQTMPSVRWNVTFNYGMGSLGLAAHYTDGGEDLVLGAPGLRAWTGGFVDLRGDKAYYVKSYQQPTETSEMFGYAVTSGVYFPGGYTYFAIGGPRYDLKGRVFLFRADSQNFVLENASPTLSGTEFKGMEIPVNGYFGATLCSVDVNNDGRDDLLVGAPFYSRTAKDGDDRMEEGLVFVYLGTDKDVTFDTTSAPLFGSDAIRGRFGSSIASLGDINLDSYNDVAIGAPYEDDLQGAVYIYNGCDKGLWPRYSQRIAAAQVRTGLQGFGISLSKAEDLNEDNIKDLAVGAYLSDQAAVLFSRPVITVQASIQSIVSDIDKKNLANCSVGNDEYLPCFEVKFCFQFEDRNYNYIELDIDIELDTLMAGYSRIGFKETRQSTWKETNFRVWFTRRSCLPRWLVVKSTADLVTPVVIQADYVMTDITAADDLPIAPAVNLFNGDNPSDPISRLVKTMEFKKDCPDNDCRTDLYLAADLVYDKTTTDFFIVGTPTFEVEVNVSKSRHPSYGSSLYFLLPRSLEYRDVQRMYGDTEIKCGYIEESEEEETEGDAQSSSHPEYDKENDFLLQCSFGNPMSNNTGVSFRLKVAVPDQVTESEFRMFLNATTLSSEENQSNNEKELILRVRNKVSTKFSGVARPSFITLRDTEDTYKLSHIYELNNMGPSLLPEAAMSVRYPQVQSGGRALLFLNKTTWTCRSPCEITCSVSHDADRAPPVFNGEEGPSYVVSAGASVGTGEVSVGESTSLPDIDLKDCLESSCALYECQFKNIPPREAAVVSLDFVVKKNILSGDEATAKLISSALVNLEQTYRLITTEGSQDTYVFTTVVPKSPPPKPLPWWIILLSVLGGILIFVIIGLILWKCGFFKRKRPDLDPQYKVKVEKKGDEEEADAMLPGDTKKEPL